MMAEFGLWGGKTKTCPLIEGASNPAISQGMTSDALEGVGAALNPPVPSSVFATDQRGKDRTTNIIGSCTIK